MYAIAFMVVSEENMIAVRDTLKPHRGDVNASKIFVFILLEMLISAS
jgi:hypothetical protein